MTKDEFIKSVENHISSLPQSNAFDISIHWIDKGALKILSVGSVEKGTKRVFVNDFGVSCAMVTQYCNTKIRVKGHKLQNPNDRILNSFLSEVTKVWVSANEYEQSNNQTHLTGSIDENELAVFNADGSEKVTRGGFDVETTDPTDPIVTADNLDLNQVRLDLISYVISRRGGDIAKLASLVLTVEPVSVDGSKTYQNGKKV